MSLQLSSEFHIRRYLNWILSLYSNWRYDVQQQSIKIWKIGLMTKLPKFNDSFLNNKHENKNNKGGIEFGKITCAMLLLWP